MEVLKARVPLNGRHGEVRTTDGGTGDVGEGLEGGLSEHAGEPLQEGGGDMRVSRAESI